MSDPLEAAFLRLRHAADADEYVPTERVIDEVLRRLDDAREQARRLDDLYEAACADIGDLQKERDKLRAALATAEAALSDIGDADRRPCLVRTPGSRGAACCEVSTKEDQVTTENVRAVIESVLSDYDREMNKPPAEPDDFVSFIDKLMERLRSSLYVPRPCPQCGGKKIGVRSVAGPSGLCAAVALGCETCGFCELDHVASVAAFSGQWVGPRDVPSARAAWDALPRSVQEHG